MVAGVRGQGREQQRCLDGGVQAGRVVDPPRRQARGVDDEGDPPVALGSPGPHDQLAAPRRRAPVDRADVVALDVLAQGVELSPLPAHPHGRAAVDLPQPREPARQVPPRVEGRQHAHRPRHVDGRLAPGDPQRSEGAHGDEVRMPVPAPHGRQRGLDLDRGTGRHRDPVPLAAGPGRRLPGVAQHAAGGPAGRVVHVQPGRGGGLGADGPDAVAGDRQAARRGGQQRVDPGDHHDEHQPQRGGEGLGAQQHRHHAQQGEHHGAAGQRHRRVEPDRGEASDPGRRIGGAGAGPAAVPAPAAVTAVTAVIAAPARRPARSAAPRRPTRPRARPRAAATGGGRAWRA